MYRLVFGVFLFAIFQGYESQQIQMPEAGSLVLPEEDLIHQVQDLQKNITELWTYIYQLRGAVTQHLNHLRLHQVELESTVHKLEHSRGGDSHSHSSHSDDHHHSGEQHSHSGDQHSHSGDQHHHSGEHHSHGGEQHHHSGEQHSHGSDSHSHSGEHHSHSGEHHSHSGEHHSHSGEHQSQGSGDHAHESHSHSHPGDNQGASSQSSHNEGDHHHHDHKDSPEKEDDLQQSQQGPGPVSEPVIVPTQRQQHNHHHHGSHGSVSQPQSSDDFKPLPVMHHHHHHDNQPNKNRSRVVIMPKYSEYDLYEFAVCTVQANRAIPDEQQQDIAGQISLWQKKRGGPLNIHIRVHGFKMGDHHGHHQEDQQQQEDNETPTPMNHKHGFHVHTNGDLSNGCQSTGPHYNPKAVTHGGPNALVRHVGDLGNIECDEHGVANIVFADEVASLTGQYSIIGKSLAIHSGEDDYGLGGNEESLKTGNAGTRIACCVIEKVEKLPIRSYRAIKTATQRQN